MLAARCLYLRYNYDIISNVPLSEISVTCLVFVTGQFNFLQLVWISPVSEYCGPHVAHHYVTIQGSVSYSSYLRFFFHLGHTVCTSECSCFLA